MADLQEGLAALQAQFADDTVDGKVQKLIALLVEKPSEEIDNSFDFKAVDADRAGYLNTLIAEALTSIFNVPTEDTDIEPLSTVQDIVDRVNNGSA